MMQHLPHNMVLAPPPPPPLSYSSDPPRRPSLAVIAICWLVILLIVGIEVVSNVQRASATADTNSDMTTMSAVGHCIVGAHVLMQQGSDPAANPVDPLVSQMESAARTPADQLRLAIISKEVQSPKVADARLKALSDATNLPANVRADLATVQTVYRNGPSAITDQQRQTLINNQGWFGKLALTFGEPNSTPDRAAILVDAKKAFVTYGAAIGIGGVGLLIGVGLIVTAIVLFALGKLALRFMRGPPDSVYLEAFAVYLAGFVVLSVLLRLVIGSPSLAWTFLLTVMLPVAVGWPVLRGRRWSDTRLQLGWHSGRGVLVEMACGIAGYIAAMPLLLVMLLITLQLMRFSRVTPSHPVERYLSGSPADLVMIYFLACVWAPVFEESMFRGALFNHLRATHGWWISAGLVGLLFAVVHPQGWTTIPVLGGIGMVLCALREWRGSLIASMTAHALNNGLVITLALLISR